MTRKRLVKLMMSNGFWDYKKNAYIAYKTLLSYRQCLMKDIKVFVRGRGTVEECI